jgi:hypothetical protein
MQPDNTHNVTIDMPWQEAMERILKAVQRECNRLNNEADYYINSLNNDPDFSNSFAAQSAKMEAEKLQDAYIVITRGY